MSESQQNIFYVNNIYKSLQTRETTYKYAPYVQYIFYKLFEKYSTKEKIILQSLESIVYVNVSRNMDFHLDYKFFYCLHYIMYSLTINRLMKMRNGNGRKGYKIAFWNCRRGLVDSDALLLKKLVKC